MAIQVTRIVIQILVFFKLCSGLEMKQSMFDKNDRICEELSKQPYFDIDLIVGKPWRIYYTWNLDLETKCLDMVVKNVSAAIVNRIYNDMHDYLQTQPEWAAATLYIRMGSSHHEMIMFADQGAEGKFLAVPNVVKNAMILPTRKAVPLLKFYIKLVGNGKYLLMIDCRIGVSSLMSQERPPYRSEVGSVVKTLNLGEGLHACLSDKKKDEDFGQK